MPLETIQHWIDLYGYAGLFFALVFGIVGLPVPDESLLTLSGYLISVGRFSPLPTFAAAALGSLSGISVSYWIGRWGGYRLIHRYGPRIHVTEERLQAVNHWFVRIGKWTLTVGYFIPGVRHLTALVAGASNLRYPVFAAFAYPGGILWITTFLVLGYSLGESWPENFHAGYRIPLAIGAVVLFAVIALVWFLRRKWSHPHSDSKEAL